MRVRLARFKYYAKCVVETALPTMKTDVYRVKMSILVEPYEQSRKIPWIAVEMISCECTCKAGRSRKCPHALALLYLIDNYHQVSEFGTAGKPKNQTWWKPSFSNKIPLTQPISHVSFCHSNPLAAGPTLHQKREHDHVRGLVLLMVATNQTIGIK